MYEELVCLEGITAGDSEKRWQRSPIPCAGRASTDMYRRRDRHPMIPNRDLTGEAEATPCILVCEIGRNSSLCITVCLQQSRFRQSNRQVKERLPKCYPVFLARFHCAAEGQD